MSEQVHRSCCGLLFDAISIDMEAAARQIREHPSLWRAIPSGNWAQSYHFCEPEDFPELTAKYILVLDALNFCFWTAPEYEYRHLAGALKKQAQTHPEWFAAESLARLSQEDLTQVLLSIYEQDFPQGMESFLPEFFAQMEERSRLVREVGLQLLRKWDGQCLNLIRAAKGSAVVLVDLVLESFPGFRDYAVYQGKQIAFHKRAQIFVGDVWGAFHGHELGRLEDLDRLTCFADYRVPQLLRSLGILKYSAQLSELVDSKTVIAAGSSFEVQIRAATVVAVERLRELLALEFGIKLSSVELDWVLWERGESSLGTLAPHHRTLTMFY